MQRGSMAPKEVVEEETRGKEVSDREDRMREREIGSDRDSAEEAGGRGGWALCREEVICQIGFHSLLRLRAACQPGRLTVSDSPLCISTNAHAH